MTTSGDTPGAWRKSKRSGNSNANCIQTRTRIGVDQLIEVRDSKAPEQGILAISRTEWAALTDSIKH